MTTSICFKTNEHMVSVSVDGFSLKKIDRDGLDLHAVKVKTKDKHGFLTMVAMNLANQGMINEATLQCVDGVYRIINFHIEKISFSKRLTSFLMVSESEVASRPNRGGR